ncbi:MAG: hypothetical protein ABSH14_16825 [Verrucomicrobiia bacterium]
MGVRTAQNPEADAHHELLQELGLAAHQSAINEGQNVAALRVPQDDQLRFTPRDQQLPHRTVQTASPR